MDTPDLPLASLEELLDTPDVSLQELLPESNFERMSTKIRNDIHNFIEYLLNNQGTFHQLIDLGIKTHVFPTTYDKKLSNFCVEVLSGDLSTIVELFIRDGTFSEPLRSSDQEYEAQLLEPIEELGLESFLGKFEPLLYLFEYIRRPKHEISPVCINYLSKLLVHLVQNRPYDLFLFLHWEDILLQDIYDPHNTLMQEDSIPSTLELLCEMAYWFGSMSETLGKLISEEGLTNKFQPLKEKVVGLFMAQLQDEQKIIANTENYENLLDFISYVFIRNKYRNEDAVEQINQVTQRLAGQEFLAFFKCQLTKAVSEVCAHSNSNQTISSNSSTPRLQPLKWQGQNGSLLMCSTVVETDHQQVDPLSHSHEIAVQSTPKKKAHKYSLNEKELGNSIFDQREFEDLLYSSEVIFHNSVSFLIIFIERLNSDEQVDPYMSGSARSQPTMNFQVDQLFYSPESVLELMTLPIPQRFSNLDRMRYYEFLLQLSRNSRFGRAITGKSEQATSLNTHSLINILIHLLKSFKKEFRTKKQQFLKKKNSDAPAPKNSLIKFYIQELLAEAIVPNIIKLEPKEAMMVISSLSLSAEIFEDPDFQEDRAFLFKMLMMLEGKCEWFSKHFQSITKDIERVKDLFATIICGDSHLLMNRSFTVKEFEFLKKREGKEDKPKKERNGSGEWSSSSGSEENQFDVKREFEFPDGEEPVSVVKWVQIEEESKEDELGKQAPIEEDGPIEEEKPELAMLPTDLDPHAPM